MGTYYVKRSVQGRDWAPYSPDLSPSDFWLHGYMKVGVSYGMPDLMGHLNLGPLISWDTTI